MYLPNLIVTGVILIYWQSYNDIVSCQSVYVITPGAMNYLEDKLKLGCSPSQVSMWGSVTHITLSKNTSTGFQDIVTVFLNFKTLQNQTIWNQSGWQNRANFIREYVNPLTTSSGLEFDIPADRVLCSDEGIYRCTVIGSSALNEPIDIEKIGTVKLKVKPTTVSQIQVSPKPEIEELYKANTVILLICTGTVGRNPTGELRWCYRRDDMFNFVGWENADDYDQGPLISYGGCQYSRTSKLRYNVSADYKYTEFRCETGGTTMECEYPSAIASNITIQRYTDPKQSTSLTNIDTAVCSSKLNTIFIVCIAILIAGMLIGFAITVLLYRKGVIVIKWKKERIYGDTNATTTTEHVYDSTTEYHMYNTTEG
ncbi:uncharacterized protein LOC134722167 [Mytilus trossulus]|uniref:uncharacterized protein LOC134722167 n=1 Tax=Mytilus trossulus TaxID=6551 RepID=UPI003007D749